MSAWAVDQHRRALAIFRVHHGALEFGCQFVAPLGYFGRIRIAQVFLRLLEKDHSQQPSVVVVEFDNHKILAKSKFVLLGQENQTATFISPVPAFYTACESS